LSSGRIYCDFCFFYGFASTFQPTYCLLLEANVDLATEFSLKYMIAQFEMSAESEESKEDNEKRATKKKLAASFGSVQS